MWPKQQWEQKKHSAHFCSYSKIVNIDTFVCIPMHRTSNPIGIQSAWIDDPQIGIQRKTLSACTWIDPMLNKKRTTQWICFDFAFLLLCTVLPIFFCVLPFRIVHLLKAECLNWPSLALSVRVLTESTTQSLLNLWTWFVEWCASMAGALKL